MKPRQETEVFVLEQDDLDASRNAYLATVRREKYFSLSMPNLVGKILERDLPRGLIVEIDQKAVSSGEAKKPGIRDALEPSRLAYNQGCGFIGPMAFESGLEKATGVDDEDEEEPSPRRFFSKRDHQTKIVIDNQFYFFPWRRKKTTLTTISTDYHLKSAGIDSHPHQLVLFPGFIEVTMELQPISATDYRDLIKAQAGCPKDIDRELAASVTPPLLFRLVRITTDNLYLRDALCSRTLPDFTQQRYRNYVNFPTQSERAQFILANLPKSEKRPNDRDLAKIAERIHGTAQAELKALADMCRQETRKTSEQDRLLDLEHKFIPVKRIWLAPQTNLVPEKKFWLKPVAWAVLTGVLFSLTLGLAIWAFCTGNIPAGIAIVCVGSAMTSACAVMTKKSYAESQHVVPATVEPAKKQQLEVKLTQTPQQALRPLQQPRSVLPPQAEAKNKPVEFVPNTNLLARFKLRFGTTMPAATTPIKQTGRKSGQQPASP